MIGRKLGLVALMARPWLWVSLLAAVPAAQARKKIDHQDL